MSDESSASPSPLRLKPRLRPALSTIEVETPALVPAAASAAAAFAAEAEPASSSLRFKPRAVTEPAAVDGVAGPEPVAPVVVGEPPKFKPKVTEPASAPAIDPGAQLIGELPSSPTPVAASAAPLRSLPPFPVVAAPGSSRTNPGLRVPHIRSEAEVDEEPAPSELSRTGRRTTGPRFAVFVLVALVAGVYFGWPQIRPLLARITESMPAPKALAPVAAAGPTPSDTLNELSQAPAAAINQAQDAMAARRASGQPRIESALSGEEVPDKTKPAAVPAAKAPVTSKPAPVKSAPATMAPVSPGLAASVQFEAAAEASPEFRAFVANAKINGVFQGSPARAMINGKLTRVGETADAGIGAVFEGVNTEKKQLIFRDRTGAVISRRY